MGVLHGPGGVGESSALAPVAAALLWHAWHGSGGSGEASVVEGSRWALCIRSLQHHQRWLSTAASLRILPDKTVGLTILQEC